MHIISISFIFSISTTLYPSLGFWDLFLLQVFGSKHNSLLSLPLFFLPEWYHHNVIFGLSSFILLTWPFHIISPPFNFTYYTILFFHLFPTASFLILFILEVLFYLFQKLFFFTSFNWPNFLTTLYYFLNYWILNTLRVPFFDMSVP